MGRFPHILAAGEGLIGPFDFHHGPAGDHRHNYTDAWEKIDITMQRPSGELWRWGCRCLEKSYGGDDGDILPEIVRENFGCR